MVSHVDLVVALRVPTPALSLLRRWCRSARAALRGRAEVARRSHRCRSSGGSVHRALRGPVPSLASRAEQAVGGASTLQAAAIAAKARRPELPTRPCQATHACDVSPGEWS